MFNFVRPQPHEMFGFARPRPRETVAWSFTKTAKWLLKVSRIAAWCASDLRRTGSDGRSEFHISRQEVAINFTHSGDWVLPASLRRAYVGLPRHFPRGIACRTNQPA
jgi:hypothetical protein